MGTSPSPDAIKICQVQCAIMAMGRLNRPSIMIYGGTIMPGHFESNTYDTVSAFQSYGEYVSGSITDDQRMNVVRNSCPRAEACGGMYTVNTMVSAIGTMGAGQNTSDKMHNTRPLQGTSNAAGGRGTSSGVFWSTRHAKDSGPNPPNGQHIGAGYPLRQIASVNSSKRSEGSIASGFEVIFTCDDSKHGSQETRTSHPESKPAFQNEACNTFVPKLDTNNHTSVSDSRSMKTELEAEVNRLQEQLKDAVLEKSEITSKYENLSAICRSQRQELHELKHALSSTCTLPPVEDRSRMQVSSNSQGGTLEGGLWELQQGMFGNNPEHRTWQAFPEKPNVQPAPHVVENSNAGSGWTTSIGANSSTRPSTAGHANNGWSFGIDNLSWPQGDSQVSSTLAPGSTSQMSNDGEAAKVETGQPAGWSGF